MSIFTEEGKQVVSKQRVIDHGEVLTGKREVNAMLNLVKDETERIESRFLEPACGTGNFVTEVLKRKLSVVESNFNKQLDYERNAFLAISSIYGIDIQEDNVLKCRKRLYDIFDRSYTKLFNNSASNKFREAIKYVLERNVILGDALTLKTVGGNPQPIVFSEWAPADGNLIKRRDFMFSYLVNKSHQTELFSNESDAKDVNQPVKDYPVMNFWEVADAEEH